MNASKFCTACCLQLSKFIVSQAGNLVFNTFGRLENKTLTEP